MIINLTGRQKGILSFTLAGGSTEPAAPLENMVWVNTEEPITGWIFSKEEPVEPPEGSVWFLLDQDASARFDPMAVNSIVLHPAGVMQYVQGVWYKYTAMCYTDGQWCKW